jgi:hypothetical protein
MTAIHVDDDEIEVEFHRLAADAQGDDDAGDGGDDDGDDSDGPAGDGDTARLRA